MLPLTYPIDCLQVLHLLNQSIFGQVLHQGHKTACKSFIFQMQNQQTPVRCTMPKRIFADVAAGILFQINEIQYVCRKHV